MLKTIWNWLTTAEHNVEAILSNFHSTVEKLDAAAVHKFAKASEHNTLALDYYDLGDAADKKSRELIGEAQSAAEVAEKLRALVAA